MKNNDYVIVRTTNAGVFAGNLEKINEKKRTVFLKNARRIWYWEGAASLSQLAVTGPMCPEKCKFPAPVVEVILFEVIEILACTKEAEDSIKAVPVWSIKNGVENDE